MNKILNRAAVLFALAGSYLFANTQEQELETTQIIENSFPYISASMEGDVVLWTLYDRGSRCYFLPGLGLGYRMQKNHHGLDLSMCFSRFLKSDSINILRADIIYNYFFNPNLESQWYTGVGISNFFSDKPIPFPKCILGKQYKNTFVEVQVYSLLIISGISFKCGIGF